MKKTAKLVFIILFLLSSMAPLLLIGIDKPVEGIEKRILATMPQLKTDEGLLNRNYLKELGTYFEDHFAYRQQMTTLDAKLQARFFGTSARDTVIVGKSGWLFYEETLDEYLGINLMTDRQLFQAAKNLSLIQEYVQEQNAVFLFTVAPDKNSLYPEYMPGRYHAVSKENNASLLVDWLKKEAVTYVDLFSELAASNEILYYDTDTHWNYLGASIACETLMNAAGKSFDSWEQVPYQWIYSHVGDLHTMLYPRDNTMTLDVVFERDFSYRYVRGRSAEDIRSITHNDGRTGAVVVYRDSFGNAMLPFLADAYGDALFSKAVPYDLSFVSELQADTVILEIVERNLAALQQTAPKMSAPERPYIDTQRTVDGDCNVDFQILDDAYQFAGSVGTAILDVDSPIFIQVSGEWGRYTAEAFLLTDNGMNAFSARIDKENLPEEEFHLEVIGVSNGDTVTIYSK